jgi:hypothetical protein
MTSKYLLNFRLNLEEETNRMLMRMEREFIQTKKWWNMRLNLEIILRIMCYNTKENYQTKRQSLMVSLILWKSTHRKWENTCMKKTKWLLKTWERREKSKLSQKRLKNKGNWCKSIKKSERLILHQMSVLKTKIQKLLIQTLTDLSKYR